MDKWKVVKLGKPYPKGPVLKLAFRLETRTDETGRVSKFCRHVFTGLFRRILSVVYSTHQPGQNPWIRRLFRLLRLPEAIQKVQE